MAPIAFLDNLLRFAAKPFLINKKHQLFIQILERISHKNTQDLQDLAIAYIGVNDGVRALGKLEEAVQKDPDGIQVNERVGSLLCFLGYPEKALHYLNKISNSLKSVTSDLNYSNHLAEMGTCHRNLKNFTSAAEFYQKSLEIYPFNIDTISEVINLYLFTGKVDLITSYLHDLLKKSPDMVPLNALLANHYHFYLLDLESAIYHYEIFENRKNQLELLINEYGHFDFINHINGYFDDYISALVLAGNREKGLSIIDEKKRNGEIDTEAIYLSELNYYQETSEWELGYALLKRLRITEKKGFNPYTLILCEYEANVGKIDSALEQAKYFHNIYPLDTNISFTYANLLQENKDYSVAIPIYKEILTRYPDFDTWRENYAYCLLSAGVVDTAIEEYKTLMTYEPYSGEVYIGYGICLFFLGEKVEGLKIVEDAFRNKKFLDSSSPICILGKEMLNMIRDDTCFSIIH